MLPGEKERRTEFHGRRSEEARTCRRGRHAPGLAVDRGRSSAFESRARPRRSVHRPHRAVGRGRHARHPRRGRAGEPDEVFRRPVRERRRAVDDTAQRLTLRSPIGGPQAQDFVWTLEKGALVRHRDHRPARRHHRPRQRIARPERRCAGAGGALHRRRRAPGAHQRGRAGSPCQRPAPSRLKRRNRYVFCVSINNRASPPWSWWPCACWACSRTTSWRRAHARRRAADRLHQRHPGVGRGRGAGSRARSGSAGGIAGTKMIR